MGSIEIFLIALGLAADSFAVAVSLGLTTKSAKKALIIGLYFGAFQAIMTIAGYQTASLFAGQIDAYGNIVAFVILLIIGGKMIFESLKSLKSSGQNENAESSGPSELSKPSKPSKSPGPPEPNISPRALVPLAIATSIDAFAVGATFAFLDVRILPSSMLIGIVAFVLSIGGVKVGGIFGDKLRTKAGLYGGVILVLIGIWMLLGT